MKITDSFLDKRVKKVGENFFDRIVEKKKTSLRGIAKNRAEEIQFGRWLRNDKVTTRHLIQSEQNRLKTLVAGRHVLGIQDTTELNYQSQSGRVKGLGTVGNGSDLGFFMHPLLVLDAQTSACLGSAEVHLWNRFESASDDYQKLPIEEKESYRWISTAERSKQVLSEADCVTFIGDRENDIYEFIDRIPDEKTHIITRMRHDRSLSNGSKLKAYLEETAEVGRIEIEVPQDLRKGRKKRKATLVIKHSEVEITKPKKCSDKTAAEKLQVWIVEAKEIEVPSNEKGIHWLLVTTHRASGFEQAKQIIMWYRNRWNIEQIFRVMKKEGLDIESSQVESGKDLMKLAVIALYAAIKIMQLVLARSGETMQSTREVFDAGEEQFLEVLLPTLEGKTEKQKNPYVKERLAWASWIIARLGGWKGYVKSEGLPGPIVMSQGLRRFFDLYEGYQLYRGHAIDSSVFSTAMA
jgi:hypothetical protein